jgi:hypothetical protein
MTSDASHAVDGTLQVYKSVVRAEHDRDNWFLVHVNLFRSDSSGEPQLPTDSAPDPERRFVLPVG